MSRLNEERQNKLEPKRIEYAKEKIEALGYSVELIEKGLVFQFNGNRITFWAYSGWHTGKGIIDGRGLDNLLKQVGDNNE
ncbi:hypothetical protein LCGC14_0364610 [marine sediment metagenome]|uniref:Uncharacterized protein n=1 Tax=marine sediment metagenome TaxID=412755 RepID=A0A0F9TCQ8_9ZZZZ